jgi:hypothetical protein
MEQQLSPQAQDALTAFRALSLADRKTVVSLASVELAAEVAKNVSTKGPEKITEASSKIDQWVQAARAASATKSKPVAEFKSFEEAYAYDCFMKARFP